MLHEPASTAEKDNASAWKAKLGIKLFWVYCLVYGGFVGTAVFAPDKMSIPVFAGTNLAITYGLFLIILAILMGVVYNHYCIKKEDEMDRDEEVSA